MRDSLQSNVQKGWRLLYDGFVSLWHVPVGEGRFHEVVESTDAVALLVYNKTRNTLVFVQQKRPALGNIEILEVMAGRRDVNLSIQALMVKEAQEELGLSIKEKDIELVNCGSGLAMSTGVMTEKIFLGYVEVESSQFSKDEVFQSGPDEVTTRVELGVFVATLFNWEDLKTWALIQWFKANKMKK